MVKTFQLKKTAWVRAAGPLVAALAMATLMTACGKKEAPPAAEMPAAVPAASAPAPAESTPVASNVPKVLNIYNWSDYIVVPGAHFAKSQIEAGLLQKLDRSKLTNWDNLDKGILAQMAKLDPGNEHLVDWMWGYVTVGINVDKVKAALGDTPLPDNVWSLLFDTKYVSKLKQCGVSVLDSASEVVPIALMYAGKPPFSHEEADYAAAAKVLKAIQPYVTRFSSSGYIEEMASGATCLVMGFSGDINIARARAAETKSVPPVVIEALIPKNGSIIYFDSMAIPKDAENVENAHLFINYILRPEVHASLTNKVFYANPNIASLKYVQKDVAENKTIFLDADVARAMVPAEPLPQALRKVQTRVFTSFKTGR
jgi:putrescine transport system substrate-binding protein